MLAFAIGYIVGANSRQEGYREVVESLRAVRESEEFGGLVSAVRSHLSASLRQLAELVDDSPHDDAGAGRLLERVRTLIGRTPMSPAS